jgi:hypothetical protein
MLCFLCFIEYKPTLFPKDFKVFMPLLIFIICYFIVFAFKRSPFLFALSPCFINKIPKQIGAFKIKLRLHYFVRNLALLLL